MSSIRAVSADIMTSHLLPFLTDREVSKIAEVSRPLNAVSSTDRVWRPRVAASGTPYVATQPPTSYKTHFVRTHALDFRMAEARRYADEQSDTQRRNLGLIIENVGIVSVTGAAVYHWFKICNLNTLVRELVWSFVSSPENGPCFVEAAKRKEHFLQVIEGRFISRLALGFDSTPVTNRALDSTRIVYDRYLTDFQACYAQIGANRDLALQQCDVARDSGLTTGSIGFIIAAPLGLMNYDWEQRQIENRETKQTNLIGGIALIGVGIMANYSDNEVIGGTCISTGAWFVIRGVVPNRVINQVCGKTVGLVHATSLWALAKMKSQWRRFKGLFG